MAKVTLYNETRESTVLDYAVNVYKDGVFVICHRYEGYSGVDVHDEVKYLKRVVYPKSEGYTIEW